MPNAKDLTPDSRFTALFVGPSGSGKKPAACSWPSPIKYLDFDGRIRGLIKCTWVNRDAIDYTYYSPMSRDKKTVFDHLNADLDQLYNSYTLSQCQYKTIVLASVTGLADALINDSIPLTHASRTQGITRGKTIGPVKMPGPEDWNFQKIALSQVLMFLKSLPLNIIVLGHTVPIWDKEKNPDGTDDPYGVSIEVGEKLSLTDKLASDIPKNFDNIFKFKKEERNGKNVYTVKFEGGIARNCYVELPPGTHDITGVNLYERIQARLISDKKEEEMVEAK